MSTDIAQAAISYFGLPEGTTLVEGGPVGAFAFIIPLTEEHLRGIADRMKAMAEPIEQAPAIIRMTSLSRDELRAEWEKMDGVARGRFGSFGRYAAHSAMGMAADDGVEIPHSEGAGGRKVQHVDAPAEEQSGLPDAVWIRYADAGVMEMNFASDLQFRDGENWTLVQTAMLSEANRAKYVDVGLLQPTTPWPKQ